MAVQLSEDRDRHLSSTA